MNYKHKVVLLLFALSVNLGAFSQNLNLRLSNITVHKAMTELKSRTGYSFVYEGADLNTKKRVTVNAQSVDEAAKQILLGQDATYKIQGKSIIVRHQIPVKAPRKEEVQQQKSTVKASGRVTDKKGEPIIGATVKVKGSGLGTVTDLNGYYSLDTPVGSLLEVSYIGYRKSLIKAGENKNIMLSEDSKALNEVVVIGYGTQRKINVTGSVATAKGSDIAEVPTTNVTNTLAGRLPGLVSYNRSGEPGYDDASLLIRGVSTLGDSSPLLVVDGVADRAGTLGRIDPNDIENITILKDASAAIYGSRAANGVILVTTKRGNAGRVKIKYNGNFAISRPTVLPKMCSSAQYAELINEINPGTYTSDQIQKYRDGSDPINYPNVDAFQTLLRNAFQTQHNVSASGGNDKVQFFSSLGYQYQDNYYKNSASNYGQYNFRSNLDFKVSKLLKISTDISFRQEDRNSPITGSEDIWRYVIKYNPMVNIWWPGTNYGNVSSKQDNFSPAIGLDNTQGYQKDRRSYLSADLTAHYDLPWLLDGLSVDAGIYFDRSNVFYKNFQKKYYLYSYSDEAYTPIEEGQNVLHEDMYKTTGITMNARLNYKHTFAGVHNVDAFVAWERYNYRYDYLYGRRQDFVSTSIDELFAGDSNTATNDGTASESARLNYFGRVSYNLKFPIFIEVLS